MSVENSHKQDFEHILKLIQDARDRTYSKANSELVLLYFNVGEIVSQKVHAGTWGDNTVQQLADYIQSKAPNLSGFNRRGLYRMKQFYELYTADSAVFKLWAETVSPVATQINNDKQAIVSPTATQLQNTDNQYSSFITSVLLQIAWANHLEIFSAVKQPEQILFYLLMNIKEKWNKLEIRRQIKTASFERTILSNKLISSAKSTLPENLFRDPYMFEFLDLPDGHSEKDLEKAIIRNLQKFILEVGKGFTYMGNQYRLQVGNKDYYTDLLFYHRDLQCLVLFELKIGDFEPEFLGKLNFYLEALDRDVKRPHEQASFGVLLCKGKDNEVVEYAMARNTSPSIIADYETKLIDKKVLAKKLHQLAQALDKSEDT
ncbi:YhcG family protein [Sphingobacterium sp. BN32]|uniref:PDDEXK nuclease domain-containing protein n=1 Tax=Sphingobacterium sp. BN32 TaxID=3058432 RepID=UPI00265CF0A6|nr:PDDEXK nuclease domain-containing protein [Sphingobacterium sp. BN32]WKK60360.1 PDDEXK nuclease domain-containing protein [Sphingobacterium sp. BN32]